MKKKTETRKENKTKSKREENSQDDRIKAMNASSDYHFAVAMEIVTLLAKRNIKIVNVDWVFALAKNSINSIPLGLVLDSFQVVAGCKSEQKG